MSLAEQQLLDFRPGVFNDPVTGTPFRLVRTRDRVVWDRRSHAVSQTQNNSYEYFSRAGNLTRRDTNVEKANQITNGVMVVSHFGIKIAEGATIADAKLFVDEWMAEMYIQDTLYLECPYDEFASGTGLAGVYGTTANNTTQQIATLGTPAYRLSRSLETPWVVGKDMRVKGVSKVTVASPTNLGAATNVEFRLRGIDGEPVAI
jgi:hypothetical protein